MSQEQIVDPITGRGQYKSCGKTKKPSIFYITADMVPPDVYGSGEYSQYLETPNLDKLIGDGVFFENAFSNSPLCGPSRASYMTGRYSYITVNEERAHDGSAIRLRDDETIFPEYLGRSGYITRHIGKCHVGPKKFIDAFGENDNPWNRWAPPVYDDDDYAHYLRTLDIKKFDFQRKIQGLNPNGRGPGNFYGGWLIQRSGAPFPMKGCYPWYLAQKARQTLYSVLSRHGNNPLYVQLDFFAPHQPFMIPSGMEKREKYLRERVRLPKSYIEARRRNFTRFEGEPFIYQTYRQDCGLYESSTMRDYIVANLLQIEVVDRALGLFLEAIKEKGLYDNSVILFCSDHGEMNGEKALIDKGVYGHPKVARVPFMLKLPENKYAGNSVRAYISLLDIAPTLLKIAGILPVDRLDGEDIVPFIGDPKRKRKKDFIFEAGWHVAPNPEISFFKKLEGRDYMYTYNLTSEYDELYDLSDKGYENFALDPEYEQVKRKMIQDLAEILKKDRRWRCYWHTFRIHKYDDLKSESGDRQMFIPE